MPTGKWLDRTQPPHLMNATLLLYINAVIGAFTMLISGGIGLSLGLAFIIGQAVAGFGIANDKKWGYWLGVGCGAILVGLLAAQFTQAPLLNLLFYIVLLYLLLHRVSREYVSTFFRW